MKIRHLLVLALAVLSFASCTQKKFHVSGTITDAKDSLLYFENMGLPMAPSPLTRRLPAIPSSTGFASTGSSSMLPSTLRKT